MIKEGRIIGQIMYVHSQIVGDDGRTIPTLTFGPISIHPDHQHKGFGGKLLEDSIKIAAELGAAALLITGNVQFYGKFGFIPAKTRGIRYRPDPEADYLLVRELREGYLGKAQGTFSDPEGYLAAKRHPDDFEKYDRQFPKKEKKKLPGQLTFA